MWTDEDITRWRDRLVDARVLGYVAARKILLEVRNEIGLATITEAHQQKRARYLEKKAARKERRELKKEGAA